jgi:hypothetical protein
MASPCPRPFLFPTDAETVRRDFALPRGWEKLDECLGIYGFSLSQMIRGKCGVLCLSSRAPTTPPPPPIYSNGVAREGGGDTTWANIEASIPYV